LYVKFVQKRGISTVVTTIIILVASVVSGTGVVLYGTSLFQGGTLTDAITVRGINIWIDPANVEPAWGAAGVRNSGDTVVSVDTIRIRGKDVPLENWYVDQDQTRVSVNNYATLFNNTGYSGSNGMLKNYDPDSNCSGVDLAIDQDGSGGESALCMKIATAAPILSPGERMVIYFKIPPNLLSSTDGGIATAVSIYAGKSGSPQSVTIAATP
jgi:hypothetical protein